jgi:hypothetical protein
VLISFDAGLYDRRKPLTTDKNGPRLDARRHKTSGFQPCIVSQALADLRLAPSLDDEKHADAPVFTAGEGPSEEDETSWARVSMNAAWSLAPG